jgi:TonB family protein
MPRSIALLFALALPVAFAAGAATPLAASAPSAAASAVATQAPLVDEMVIAAGSPRYPQALADTGAHGRVEVLAALGADGRPTSVTVAVSSRSAELDAAARSFVGTLGFGRPAGSGEPALVAVRVPVRFQKESIRTLEKKTCADFETDAAWFRAAFPERQPLTMDVLNMTRSWLLASGYALQPPERRAAWLKAMYVGLDAGIAACATRPDARFLKTVQAAVDDATEAVR